MSREEVDDDLRDVFKLLYAADDPEDWAVSDDDAADSTGTINVTSPSSEVDRVDQSLSSSTKTLYTRKRYLEALDSLIDRSQPKKARIYPPSTRTTTSSSITSSTTPFPSLPPADTYAPYSPLPLLSRLRTFAQGSFVELDAPLDPVTLSKDGWTCRDRESIQCGQCGAVLSLAGVMDIRESNVRKEVVRRLGLAIERKHEDGCPWRIKASPDELIVRLRRMLHPTISSSLAALVRGLQRDCPLLASMQVQSPVSHEQTSSLQASLAKYASTANLASDDTPHKSSTNSALLALFAWFPYHPNSTSTHVDLNAASSHTEIIHCRICQRRVGLWAFTDPKERRSLDAVAEHLTWCPLRVGSWWNDLPLLHTGQTSDKNKDKVEKGWLTLSDKLEKKKWRRI